MLTFCIVVNIHVEKHLESMLNIYSPHGTIIRTICIIVPCFPFTKPSSGIALMPQYSLWYMLDRYQVLHSVMSKHSIFIFEFSFDKFFTFALKILQLLVVTVQLLLTETFYISCLFHILLACFIKLVMMVLHLACAGIFPGAEVIHFHAFYFFRVISRFLLLLA